jgi:hypothetical protein
MKQTIKNYTPLGRIGGYLLESIAAIDSIKLVRAKYLYIGYTQVFDIVLYTCNLYRISF